MPNEDNALVIACNFNGDTLWSTVFGSDGIDAINQMLCINDTEFVFTGMKKNDFWFGKFVISKLPIKVMAPLMRHSHNILQRTDQQVFTLLGRKTSYSSIDNFGIFITTTGGKIILPNKYTFIKREGAQEIKTAANSQ